ncbi:MAG: DMT family transporter [Pirellulales bacterium]|nr:DMT family transporter [Pirellulales bacterium]
MTLVTVTALTLVAFAANSLLCRMALAEGQIDPVSFTTLRLTSGALALWPIARMMGSGNRAQRSAGSWLSGFALFAYAIAFSLAYVTLNAGMGALILFGSVQVTMLAVAVRAKEPMGAAQWTGLAAAFGGLVYLVAPGISAPNPIGALLMCVAGIAWGVYSIRGKGAAAPVAMTAANFARAAPMAMVATVIAFASRDLQTRGVLLALVSGVITSGLGYVLWYQALRGLTTTQASIAQLLVPVVAAFGGVVFLAEEISTRLVVASALILGGVALAILRRGTRDGKSTTTNTTTR